MPTGGGWVIAAVAVGVVFCAAMWGWHSWRGRERLKPNGHPVECACEGRCWPEFKQQMRDIAARQAAEINQQEKQR